MNHIENLIAKIANAATDDGDATREAAIADLRKRRPRTREQLEMHRDLHRKARKHVDAIDAHNAANPENPRQPLPQMLAYRAAFAYLEKDT